MANQIKNISQLLFQRNRIQDIAKNNPIVKVSRRDELKRVEWGKNDENPTTWH